MTDKKAQLTVDGLEQPIEFPVLSGTVGPDVIDIAALTKNGYFTYDPGFVSTASCESKITYIDGANGVLLHRGYPIEVLAEKSNYLESCYMLLHGELPNKGEYEDFVHHITNHTMMHESISRFFRGFHHDSHPMAMMCGAVGALSAFYHDSLDITDANHRLISAYRLIAKMPTNQRHARPFAKGLRHSLVLARAMDQIFLLHADHEQNASTSTVRLAGSSGANPFACIAAGIATLWGPAHGGANEAVLDMLAEIGDESNIDNFILRAKDKNDPFRLMGFGHRVYKNFDPRAKVMKQACDEVLSELGLENDPLLKIAKRLEQIALEDDYFIEKKLYPNVDFYSGIIMKAIGIPTEMFTVIFATGRTVGWIAHWHEMVSEGFKIGRPRQLYTGSDTRDYTAIDKR